MQIADNEAVLCSQVARADAHFAARRISEAVVEYGNVLTARPCNLHVLHRMCLAHLHLDDHDQAWNFIQQALCVAPEQAELWEHAGLIAALKREPTTAETFYRHAIDLAGGTASLYRNLADCLRHSGRLTEAKEYYERTVESEPTLHHGVYALAQINRQLGDLDAALRFALRAWALRPAATQADLDNILALLRGRDIHAVDETLNGILTRAPADVSALKAVTYVLVKLQRYKDALSVALQGIAIDPDNAIFLHHAAWALRRMGRISECRPFSEAAAKMLPCDPDMQSHFADVLLSLGNFEDGWRLYKSFYDVKANRRVVLCWPECPEWSGEPVDGRQFLLVGEQGLGDQIQFLRFAVWLHQHGAIVDVVVNSSIVELAATMPSIRTVFDIVPPAGSYDYWAHMFRVPEHINLDLAMLPVTMPYVTVTQEKLAYWQARLEWSTAMQSDTGNKRIGIVWAGNPGNGLDRFRSIQLDALQLLFTISGVTWYSLQKGLKEKESQALVQLFDVHTLGPEIEGFGDTLAALHSLDLLITVDSSVAHLAGAAGLPVWTLIPAYTDWRWMTVRTDSPWYPSMRLFRQRELGDWAPVIEEVRIALLDHLNSAPDDACRHAAR